MNKGTIKLQKKVAQHHIVPVRIFFLEVLYKCFDKCIPMTKTTSHKMNLYWDNSSDPHVLIVPYFGVENVEVNSFVLSLIYCKGNYKAQLTDTSSF